MVQVQPILDTWRIPAQLHQGHQTYQIGAKGTYPPHIRTPHIPESLLFLLVLFSPLVYIRAYIVTLSTLFVPILQLTLFLRLVFFMV